MLLTREAIEAAAKKRNRTKDVTLSELGGDVRIRNIRADDFIGFVAKHPDAVENGVLDIQGKDAPKAMAMLICLSVIDAKGERMFSDDDFSQVALMFPPTALPKLAMEIISISDLKGSASTGTPKKKPATRRRSKRAKK